MPNIPKPRTKAKRLDTIIASPSAVEKEKPSKSPRNIGLK